MQILEQTQDRLTLTDRKNAFWSRFSSIILTVAVIAGVVWVLKNVDQTAQIAAAVVFGTIFVGVGIAILIKESYTSVVVVHRSSRTIVFEQDDFLKKRTLTFAADEIKAIEIVDEGVEVKSWAVCFETIDGSTVRLSASLRYDHRSEADATKHLIESYLNG